VPPHNMVHTIRFTGPAGHRRTTVTRWQLPTWLRRPSSRKGDTSVSIPRVYDYWTVRGPRGSHAGTIGGELLDSSRGHPTMAGRPPRSRDWAVGRPRPPRYVPCCLHLWRRTQTCPRFLLSLAMLKWYLPDLFEKGLCMHQTTLSMDSVHATLHHDTTLHHATVVFSHFEGNGPELAACEEKKMLVRRSFRHAHRGKRRRGGRREIDRGGSGAAGTVRPGMRECRFGTRSNLFRTGRGTGVG